VAAGTCECGKELSGSINAVNFLTGCKPVSFSRRTLLHGVSKLFYSCPKEYASQTLVSSVPPCCTSRFVGIFSTTLKAMGEAWRK
jgi:hypothetical protein